MDIPTTPYDAFDTEDDDTDDDTVNTITVPQIVPQAAAAATVATSFLGTAPGSTMNPKTAAAISQLSAN